MSPPTRQAASNHKDRKRYERALRAVTEREAMLDDLSKTQLKQSVYIPMAYLVFVILAVGFVGMVVWTLHKYHRGTPSLPADFFARPERYEQCLLEQAFITMQFAGYGLHLLEADVHSCRPMSGLKRVPSGRIKWMVDNQQNETALANKMVWVDSTSWHVVAVDVRSREELWHACDACFRQLILTWMLLASSLVGVGLVASVWFVLASTDTSDITRCMVWQHLRRAQQICLSGVWSTFSGSVCFSVPVAIEYIRVAQQLWLQVVEYGHVRQPILISRILAESLALCRIELHTCMFIVQSTAFVTSISSSVSSNTNTRRCNLPPAGTLVTKTLPHAEDEEEDVVTIADLEDTRDRCAE